MSSKHLSNETEVNNNINSSPEESFHYDKTRYNDVVSSFSSNGSTRNTIEKPETRIVWKNVILMSILHLAAFYGFWITLTTAKWQSVIAVHLLGLASSIGVQAGAHRLWSHRAYKAKWQLRIILAMLQTMALQNDIYEWCRDHRVHHKHSETDADPHNSKRGFFFSHMGWLMVKKHPHVISKGKQIDLTDLINDPIVRYQRKFYIPLVILFWAIIPTLIPYYLCGETLWNSFFLCVPFRYLLVLHNTWLVNSAAHMWGGKPYDDSIEPRECVVRYILHGEGYHNYHHTFPCDYSASEHGWMINFNTATMFIDLFAKIGWAYDLKKVHHKTVMIRQMRTGNADDIKTQMNGLKDNLQGIIVALYPVWLVFLGKYFIIGKSYDF